MMNKQKTNKAGGWKAAIFLPVLALLLLTFCKPGEKELLGTWKLVSYQYGDRPKVDSLGNFNAVELITPGHFTWVHYSSDNKTVFDSAGGTYVFDGDSMIINVEYGGKGMIPYIGKSKYKIKLKDDQMFLSGSLFPTGLKLNEVWKKL